MISVRASGRLVLGTLLTATLALSGSAPSGAAPRTDIEPASLAGGGYPHITYLDNAAEQVVLPDGHTISTTRFRGDGLVSTGRLLHVRGGWLLPYTVHNESGRQLGTRVDFLSTAGHSRVVVEKAPFQVQAVSADGRWYVAEKTQPTSWHAGDPPPSSTLRAVQVSNGHQIGTLRVPSILNRAAVLSVGTREVLLRTVSRIGKSYVHVTSAWTPSTGAVRELDRRKVGNAVPRGTGSSAAHLYTAPGGRVLDSRTQRVLWRAPRGDVVLSFSPDDSRVVTADRVYSDDYTPGEVAHRLQVRNARTGKLLSTFTGTLDSGFYAGPVWESETSLLIRASGKPYYDPDTDATIYPDQALVRCSVVSGACRRTPVPVGVSLMVRKSN